MRVTLSVNGKPATIDVEPRRTLADALREDLGLTGTHLGCEHGVCGACTVMLDGLPVRACLVLAVQAEGASLLTVEGLAGEDGALHPLQQSFTEHHALQCGFCTPGMLISALDLLNRIPNPTRAEIRSEMSGNICRCTGYNSITDAILAAARSLTQKD
ncbi:MAG: (2Fe-2S)-binding protein [Acidimicrobiaceae bacterium]|nr:(2Fe-2S)-binding protein [Acidimicrobiaceae bacterium]